MTDSNDKKPEEPIQEDPPLEATSETEGMNGETESATTSAYDAKTIEEGKIFALLSYALNFIGIPFCIVPLITRDNAYSLYHAKQSLTLLLAAAVVGVVSSILVPVFCIGFITGTAGGLFLFVLNIMGLIQTLNGEAKPLPLIGKYAVDWFKGVKVIQK